MPAFALLLLTLTLTIPWQVEGPPTPTVAFFGDSLTAGLHATAEGRTYRELLVARLNGGRDGGPPVAVIQHPYGLLDDAQLRLPLVLAARPQIVFLELGHHELWAPPSEIDRFAERYADILDKLLDSGAEVVPTTLAWLGYPPETYEYGASLRINAIIRAVAAQRDLAVADLWSATDLRYDLISTPDDVSHIDPYLGDDLHPNDAGHLAMAEAVWQAYRIHRGRPPVPRVQTY